MCSAPYIFHNGQFEGYCLVFIAAGRHTCSVRVVKLSQQHRRRQQRQQVGTQTGRGGKVPVINTAAIVRKCQVLPGAPPPAQHTLRQFSSRA